MPKRLGSPQRRIYAELAATAMPYIRQRPGLTADRLLVCLGLRPFVEHHHKAKGAVLKTSHVMRGLLTYLEQEGLAQVVQDVNAKQGEYPRVYPADWQPRPRPTWTPPPVTVSYLENHVPVKSSKPKKRGKQWGA